MGGVNTRAKRAYLILLNGERQSAAAERSITSASMVIKAEQANHLKEKRWTTLSSVLLGQFSHEDLLSYRPPFSHPESRSWIRGKFY